ncbi:oligogalacturonide transport system substrate-binding protein [Thermohydrogenium kirishiense]|nr:oligogalacturonide transport system substrate-binding protein [Thermohydrogenium kirishiense]
MKMFKKIVSTFLVLLLILSLLSGCSSSSNSSKSSSKNSNTSQKTVTLRFMWWGGDDRHKATLDAISLYEKEHPNVKIIAEDSGYDGYLQKLVTELSGGTAPDIMQLDVPWVQEILSQGDFFVDLSQQKNIDVKAFDEKFLKAYSYYDNKLIGLPTGINNSTLYINKDFFDKFGISEKTVWNWDNFLETAKMVHQKDKNAYFLNADSQWCYFILKSYVIQRTGSQWINDDYTLGFDKKTLNDAFTYLNNLFEVGGIEPFSQSAPFELKPDQNPLWLNGQIGTFWDWSSIYAINKSNIKNLVLTLPPIAPDAKQSGIEVRPSQLIAINKNSKNIEEAANFLNWFFTDPEAIKILKDVRGIPATENARKILTDNNELDEKLNELVTNALEKMSIPENAISQNQEIEKLSRDIIQQLNYKQLTPDQATNKLINSYNEKLSELKKQSK